MWIRFLEEFHLVRCCTRAVRGQSPTPYFFTGKLTLTNLRFKKGALDKLKLPVDVLEGLNSPPFSIFLA